MLVFIERLIIIQGYVEDRRNTDNAWIETAAIDFHDDRNIAFQDLSFSPGTADFCLEWHPIDALLPVRSLHREILSFVGL